MPRKTPTVYVLQTVDGYHLTLTVEPADVQWTTWHTRSGSPDTAEMVLTPLNTIRTSELIDGQFVLNAGPVRPGHGGDRDWTWAREQIIRGVLPGRDHVLVPPGERTASAKNLTSKWSWIFLDIYDLEPGGVSWAPYEHQSPFSERANTIANDARRWLDAAQPEWRTESERLGIDADLHRQRDDIEHAQKEIRNAKANIVERRRRITVLKSQQTDA